MSNTNTILECISQLQKVVECSICLDSLKDPIETRCGHTFCSKCIQRALNEKVSVPCPLCKKTIKKRSLRNSAYLSCVIAAFEGVKTASYVAIEQKDTVAMQPLCASSTDKPKVAPSNASLLKKKFRVSKKSVKTPDLLDVVDNLCRLKQVSVTENLSKLPDLNRTNDSISLTSPTEPNLTDLSNNIEDPFDFPVSQKENQAVIKKQKTVKTKCKKIIETKCEKLKKGSRKKAAQFGNIKNISEKSVGNEIYLDKGKITKENKQANASPLTTDKKREITNAHCEKTSISNNQEQSNVKQNNDKNDEVDKLSKKKVNMHGNSKSCSRRKSKKVKFCDELPPEYLAEVIKSSPESSFDGTKEVTTEAASFSKCAQDHPLLSKRLLNSDVSSESGLSDKKSLAVTKTNNQDVTDKVSFWLKNVDPSITVEADEKTTPDNENSQAQSHSDFEDLLSASQVVPDEETSIFSKERKYICENISELRKEAAEKEAEVFGTKTKLRYAPKTTIKDVHFYGRTTSDTQDCADESYKAPKSKAIKTKKSTSKRKSKKKRNQNIFDTHGLSQGVSPFGTPTKDDETKEAEKAPSRNENAEGHPPSGGGGDVTQHDVASTQNWNELEEYLKVVKEEIPAEKQDRIDCSSFRGMSQDGITGENRNLRSSISMDDTTSNNDTCTATERQVDMNLRKSFTSPTVTKQSVKDKAVSPEESSETADEQKSTTNQSSLYKKPNSCPSYVDLHLPKALATSQTSSQESRSTDGTNVPKTTVVTAIVYPEPKSRNKTGNNSVFKTPPITPQNTKVKLKAKSSSHFSNGVVRLDEMPIVCVGETQEGSDASDRYYVETPAHSEETQSESKNEKVQKVNSPKKFPSERTVELGLFDFSEPSQQQDSPLRHLRCDATENSWNMPRDTPKSSQEITTCKSKKNLKKSTSSKDLICSSENPMPSSLATVHKVPISKVDKGKPEVVEDGSGNAIRAETKESSSSSQILVTNIDNKDAICELSEETTLDNNHKYVPSAKLNQAALLQSSLSSEQDTCDSSLGVNVIENTEDFSRNLRNSKRHKSQIKKQPAMPVENIVVKPSLTKQEEATKTISETSAKDISVIEETPQVKSISLHRRNKKIRKSVGNLTKSTSSDKQTISSDDKFEKNCVSNKRGAKRQARRVTQTVSKSGEDFSVPVNQASSCEIVDESRNNLSKNVVNTDKDLPNVTDLLLSTNATSQLSIKDKQAVIRSAADTVDTYVNEVLPSPPTETPVVAKDKLRSYDGVSSKKSAYTNSAVFSRDNREIPSSWPKAASPKLHRDSQNLPSCGIVQNLSVVVSGMDEEVFTNLSKPIISSKVIEEKGQPCLDDSPQDTISSSPLLFAQSQTKDRFQEETEGPVPASKASNEIEVLKKLLNHVEEMKTLCKTLSETYSPLSRKILELESEVCRPSVSRHCDSSSSGQSSIKPNSKRPHRVISSSDYDVTPVMCQQSDKKTVHVEEDSDIEIYSSLPKLDLPTRRRMRERHRKPSKHITSVNKPDPHRNEQNCDQLNNLSNSTLSPKDVTSTEIKRSLQSETAVNHKKLPANPGHISEIGVIEGSRRQATLSRKRILSSSDEGSSPPSVRKKRCKESPSKTLVQPNSELHSSVNSESVIPADKKNFQKADVESPKSRHEKGALPDRLHENFLDDIVEIGSSPFAPSLKNNLGDKTSCLIENREFDANSVEHSTCLDDCRADDSLANEVEDLPERCRSPLLTSSQVRSPTPPPSQHQCSFNLDTSEVDNLLKRISEMTSANEAEERNENRVSEKLKTAEAQETRKSPSRHETSCTRDDEAPAGSRTGLRLVDKSNSSSASPNPLDNSDFSVNDTSMCNATKRLGIMVSGLRGKAVGLVKVFTKKWGGKFFESFVAGEVTHTIVRTQDMRCDRTLKYLQAVASKAWVISISWITQSLKQKTILPEEKFEVIGDNLDLTEELSLGPKRSRLSPQNFRLLSGYVVHCIPPFALFTQAQFVELLRLCGARVVPKIDDLTHAAPEERRVITVDPDGYSNELPKYAELGDKYRAETASCSWVLDCIATFRLQPPSCFPIEDMDSEIME